jgi:hypothetical protein
MARRQGELGQAGQRGRLLDRVQSVPVTTGSGSGFASWSLIVSMSTATSSFCTDIDRAFGGGPYRDGRTSLVAT